MEEYRVKNFPNWWMIVIDDREQFIDRQWYKNASLLQTRVVDKMVVKMVRFTGKGHIILYV